MKERQISSDQELLVRGHYKSLRDAGFVVYREIQDGKEINIETVDETAFVELFKQDGRVNLFRKGKDGTAVYKNVRIGYSPG